MCGYIYLPTGSVSKSSRERVKDGDGMTKKMDFVSGVPWREGQSVTSDLFFFFFELLAFIKSS